jgi:hypothetical protein
MGGSHFLSFRPESAASSCYGMIEKGVYCAGSFGSIDILSRAYAGAKSLSRSDTEKRGLGNDNVGVEGTRRATVGFCEQT